MFENTSKTVNELKIYINECPSLTELVLPDSLVKGIDVKIVNSLNIGPISIGKDDEQLDARINFDDDIVNDRALVVDKRNANYRYDQGVLWDLKNKMASMVTYKVEKAYFPEELNDLTAIDDLWNLDKCRPDDAVKISWLNGFWFKKYYMVGDYGYFGFFFDGLKIDSKQIIGIDDYAFANCKLRRIIMPLKLEKVGKAAFINCDNLKNVYMPDSLKYIGEYAFANCDNLSEVSVNANTYIERNAFYGSPNVVLKVRNDSSSERIFKRGEPYWPWMPVLNNPYFSSDGLAGIYIGENDIYEINNGKSYYLKYEDALSFNGTKTIAVSDDYTQYAIYDKGQTKICFAPNVRSRGSYGVLGDCPVDLREIYLPVYSPYRTLSDGKIDRQYTREIVLEDSFKRNIVLYVPEGCSRNFIDVPGYQGFKAIKEMSDMDFAMIKIGYTLKLQEIASDKNEIMLFHLAYMLISIIMIYLAIYPIKYGLSGVSNRRKRSYVIHDVLCGAIVMGGVYSGTYLALVIIFSIKVELAVSIAVVAMLVSEICFYYLPLPRGERMPPWLKKLLRRKGRSDNAIID